VNGSWKCQIGKEQRERLCLDHRTAIGVDVQLIGLNVKRGMLVRRLASFHVAVDVRVIEEKAVHLWFDDGGTITLGSEGLVEVAR
jgi:hypothetical protein